MKRELDVSQLLQIENIDILFLTETDVIIQNEEDFKFYTYIHRQSPVKTPDLYETYVKCVL